MASNKPIVSTASNFVYTSMAPVIAGVGPGGAPTTLGRGMAPSFPAPVIPNVSFHMAGQGRTSLIETVPPTDVRFNRGPKIAGQQGTLDAWVVMSAAGTARDICTVADTNDVSALTGEITFSISATTNRPFITIRDELGTIVAQTTPAAGAYADGERVHLRMAWDSAAPIPGAAGGRHVTFAINGEEVPVGDWSTDPTSAWGPFVPVEMWLRVGSTNSDFNGTVLALQGSNVASP